VVARALALVLTSLCCALLAPAVAGAQAEAPPTGGTRYAPPAAPAPSPAPTDPGAPERPTVPGARAVLLPSGVAAAPTDAPPQVQAAVWAANELREKPYRYGGGHRDFADAGYDCSGTVSYALHGGGLLDHPLDSSSFLRWGEAGRGAWITVYTNPGHAFVIIAGLRLDTSSAGVNARRFARTTALERGPRWRPTARSTRGYVARHPPGL
jgi:hypothetical protein